MSPVEETNLFGWDRLRHGGLLLDPPRLRVVAASQPTQPLLPHLEKELRRQVAQVQDGTLKASEFAVFVLQEICGFTTGIGTWQRGSAVGAEWARPGVAGEAIKPRHLWRGDFGTVLPVFIDTESRLGIGRGTKAASQTLQWLRAGKERLALLTNGRQWRLVFAGLDFDAWCQWDVDLWFEEGAIAPQVAALRTLLQPALWTPEKKDATPALLQAILDSRKGQAELSAVLGERVREAVELLVQAHGDILKRDCADVDTSDIYRAAVRIVMRLVVVLFAESREKLLPRDNAFYHGAYGLTGLREELDKVAARAGSRLKRSSSAWPRVLALFRLIFDGSHHPDLPVPEYGGELLEPGNSKSREGLARALSVFETACFEHDLLLPDSDVHRILELLTRTKVRIRQGRASTWAPVPVDFSDLSSEYIGILYEGLLDFELKTAPSGDPVIFLAVGNQPALPLSRLEGMDDKAVASLLEKMKDTNGPEVDEEADGESQGEDNEGADDGDIEDEDEDAAAPADDDVADGEGAHDGDERFITRTRAEEWARRAVVVGKLATKPRGALTGQKKQEWGEKVAKKARQIVARVILPGEWYLVRWGGTRKGSGTFYTRPGLAVPTVHRTLRPLAYVAPSGADGTPDLDAPATQWLPRTPEEILALKVCDPACGSGTFPVAALRFLTDALYSSLHQHGRISETGDRAIVRLLDRGAASEAEDLLGSERLACRPSDETFEPRLKAVLRRHVVERCIYGVDLDPLAVELCRLALWIETMDRDLPFSFLDHKIKCGNSLVGAWFDTFQHYPVMAWKNREGGDKGHTNGVHFEKEARTKAIKAFVRDSLTPDLQTFLRGRTLFHEDLQERAAQAHAGVLAVLSRLHELPVHAAGDRARVYRDEVVGSSEYQALSRAMNLWCTCWFWPARDLAQAPLPTTLATPLADTVEAAERLSARKRFFHWELEFPDVFNAGGSGFDAILGNPPWDIAKPSSKEFFSNIDPLYRAYGKQEAIERQTEYFADPDIEERWLDYNGDFRAQSNLVGYTAFAFGDPDLVQKPEDRFTIVRGGANLELHGRWRRARAHSSGFADCAHAFQHQGSADLNLYKLFLEQAHALLRPGGRLGFIVPSGLYSDHGTGDIRRLFMDRCRWEWLFGFENRDGIFDIHRSFKFNPIIIEKGAETRAIHTAFMRRRIEEWEMAESLAMLYPKEQIGRFSPIDLALLEFVANADVSLTATIVSHALPASSEDLGPRQVRFAKGDFDMVAGARRGYFVARDINDQVDFAGRGLAPDGERLLPLYEGRMVAAFDCSQKGWVKGRGRSAVWREVDISERVIQPQWFVRSSTYFSERSGLDNPRVGFVRVTANTNTRTMHAALLPPFPTGFTVSQLRPTDGSWATCLELTTVLNSFVFDFVVRRRVCGLDIAWFHIQELPLPSSGVLRNAALLRCSAALSLTQPALSPAVIALSRDGILSPTFRLAFTRTERLRLRCVLDAVVAAAFGLHGGDVRTILDLCDQPVGWTPSIDADGAMLSKGFWRVDQDEDPELRHTVLTLVAFADLEDKIRAAEGDRERGIQAFLNQNDGEGWMLPETLRLADYGLGHDERAKHPQPVVSRLGPRFYDWQLAQTAEESWRECEIHAKNLQATGEGSSGGVPPAETTINLRRVSARGKRRRQEEKDLLSLDGLEDEPA